RDMKKLRWKVASAGPNDPSRAHDQMIGVSRRHSLFPVEFRRAVGIDRIWLRIFRVWRVGGAGEHLVCADLDHRRPRPCGGLGDIPCSLPINDLSTSWIARTSVDIGPRS